MRPRPLIVKLFLGIFFVVLLAVPHISWAEPESSDDIRENRIGIRAGLEAAGTIPEGSTKALIEQTEAEKEAAKGVGSIANFVGWILYWIASFFSWLVSILVGVLVNVSTYNNFLNHRIVLTGWQIIRDICNNFFIVGLLVISVATILRQPASYQYQQALGKLLVMAVLINFSKLFTGILIDVSQVITIYFGNALASSGGQVILYAMGLFNLYQAQQGGTDTWNNYGSAVWALLYALILSVIAAVVVGSIIMVLVYRIVTLWFLVILSPAAFLAKAIPGQEKYFSEWLSTLSKELIVAPVMLFFLYLSLFAGAIDPSKPSASKGSPSDNPIPINGVQGANTPGALNANLANNTQPVQLLDFLLIVGLLVGSLVAGQRVGAKGSSWAGSGVAKLDSWRKKGANFAKSVPGAVGQAVDDRLGVRAGVARGLSQVPIIRSTPFIGRALTGAAAGYAGGTAKREQEAISNRAAALRVDQMTEDQKRALAARSGDRYGRIAAIQSLVQSGQIRDDAQGPERARDLALINQARAAMATSPELQAKLDDSLRKYMPSMAAASTMYTNNAGQVDIARLESDMRTGKMDMSKMMTGITDPASPEFTRLQAGIAARMGGNPDDAFARFTMRVANNDEKEMGKIFGAMSDEVKNEVTQHISQASFQAPGAAPGAITPAEIKNRDAFLKASGAFNRLQDAFVNDADRDNWVKENGELIASKATVGQIGAIVESVGHALDPKQIEKLKGRSKAFETAVQTAFSTLADSLDPAMLTAGHPDFDRAKSVYQNALLGGGTINLNRADGNDAVRQSMIDTVMQGKKKEDILKNMHSNNINEHFIRATANTLSGKDIEKLTDRSTQDKARTRTALSAAVASLDAATIANPATTSIARNIMRNAASSGATFVTAMTAPGTDQAARNMLFGDVVGNLSAGDLKNSQFSAAQINILARQGNIAVLKSFFVDPGNNIALAQNLAAEIRPMATGTPAQMDRYNKLKDFL